MIPLSLCTTSEAPLVETSVDDLAAVERFARHLAVLHRSPDTVRLYLGAVRRWLAAGGTVGHVDGALLARWLARRRDCCAPATVNLDVKALRAFYRCQHGWGSCSDLDLARALTPRQRKPPPRVVRWLTDAQVGEVLGALPLDTFLGLRDYAIVLTLYGCGLRAGELAAMEVPDLIDGQLLYVRGKARRDRYVPVGEQHAGVLAGYLHARAGLRPGKRNAFWLKRDGRPLRNGRSIWEIVSKRIWQALGLRSGLHRVSRGGPAWQGHYPHLLRASFATALLHRGMPITAIAQLMGHASTATTAYYLGVDLAHLRRAAACHPRAFRK